MRPDPTYDAVDDVPGTGRAVKLYVPQSPGAPWSIAVDRYPKSHPTGHPQIMWNAVWWGAEIRMPEEMLRAFVKHAATVLRMTLVEIETPPTGVASMDDETVPAFVVGLPEFSEPATAVEPVTEAW